MSQELILMADMAVTTGKLLMAVLATIFLKNENGPIFERSWSQWWKPKVSHRSLYKAWKSHEGPNLKKKWSSTNQHFQWYPHMFYSQDMSRPKTQQLMVSMVKSSGSQRQRGDAGSMPRGFFDSQMVEVGSSSPRTNCPWKKFKECILPQKS